MDKQEFIDRLRTALNGRIVTEQVTDNIRYYEDYINTEIRKGRTEEDVLDSLGDPRLIAKTIIQTQSGDSVYMAEDSGYREMYGETEKYSGYRSDGDDRKESGGFFAGRANRFMDRTGLKLPGWLWTILAVIVVILIVAAVFSMLSFLAPLLIVMAAVIFMTKLFRDWLN